VVKSILAHTSEKALARRQLIVKPDSSTSWFVGIKHLHRKYELKEAISYLDEPESKTKWTRTVLYIRILLLCSIYDPVSNLSFTESLEMSLPVWQLTAKKRRKLWNISSWGAVA
jgi:hypothetical protein